MATLNDDAPRESGTHRRSNLHAALVAGREAYQSIKESQRQLWADWLVVGRALKRARSEAMHLASTNKPSGRRYSTEMSRLLAEYGLDELGKAASHLLNVMDHLPAVEEWRSKQPDPDALNHPSWVWQRFSRSSRGQDDKNKKKHQRDRSLAAQIKELKRELEHRDARILELEEEKQSHQSSEAPDTANHDVGKDEEDDLSPAQKLRRMKDSLVILAGQAVDCAGDFQSVIKEYPAAISREAISQVNQAAKMWQNLQKVLNTSIFETKSDPA